MWPLDSRFSRHERQDREDFKLVRGDIKKVSKALRRHGNQTAERVSENHAENKEAIAAIVTSVDKLKRMIWIATGAVAVLAFIAKEFLAPNFAVSLRAETQQASPPVQSSK